MNSDLVALHVEVQPRLASLDPRLKLSWLMSISLLAVMVDGLPALLALVAVSALPLLGCRLSLHAWGVLIVLVGLTIWTTMLSQGLFYKPPNPTPVVEWGPVLVSREGLMYGLVQSLRFVASVLAGLTVIVSTSPERLLAALTWLRAPSAVAFVTVTALRSLPTLIDEWVTIRRARKLRAEGAPASSLGVRLGGELMLLVPLVAVSLRRAAILATSVTLRGFQPGQPRTFYPPLKMTNWECCLGVVLGLVCAVVGGWRAVSGGW